MSLDPKVRRLASVLEPDVARMLERQSHHTVNHHDVVYDAEKGVVAYYRHDTPIWVARGEPLGSYSPEIGLYRWPWAQRAASTTMSRCRTDEIFREGQRYGVPELSHDQLYVDTDGDADTVANLGACLARADGVLRLEEGTRIVYVALYEVRPGEVEMPVRAPRPQAREPAAAPASLAQPPGEPRKSVPPAWLAPAHAMDHDQSGGLGFTPGPVGSGVGAARYSVHPPSNELHPPRRPTVGFRNVPLSSVEVGGPALPEIPKAPVAPRLPQAPSAPPPPVSVREPQREIFLPVAQASLVLVARALPSGFREALVLLTVDTHEGKGRYFVQIVASDASGKLVCIDPSRELLDAAGHMIADDARSGNGRWRKLTARLTATARGASIELEIKA